MNIYYSLQSSNFANTDIPDVNAIVMINQMNYTIFKKSEKLFEYVFSIKLSKAISQQAKKLIQKENTKKMYAPIYPDRDKVHNTNF